LNESSLAKWPQIPLVSRLRLLSDLNETPGLLAIS
jgi:hypothetical protein